MQEVITTKEIENMIYEIRGKQVMLDSDLAKLYQCTNGTKDINKAVKRNLERFPNDFYFQVTKEEYNEILRFQNGTLELEQGKYRKYLPYVFTEQGIAMLSSVLKTSIASIVSIHIMRAFVFIRKYISNNLIEKNDIKNMMLNHDDRISILEKSFSKFEEKKKVNEIYFNGQIYDAYSKIVDILKEAKKELFIVDAYADKTTLDIIKNLKVNVTLIINDRSKLTKLDIEKYNAQYSNLNLIYNNSFHDRYFILDKQIVYHCGTSINDAGSKTFSINKLDDEIVIKNLIKKVSVLN